MKKIRKIMSVVMVGVLLIGAIISAPAEASAKKPALAYERVSILVGDSATIKIKNTTKKSVKKLTVSVKDKSIVSAVAAGAGKKTAIRINGKKTGSTTVYLKIKTKKTYKLSLTVRVTPKENQETEDSEAIGIIGAMEEEVSLLKKTAGIKKTTKIAGMEFCEGTIEGKSVVIVQCGMGKVNAGICANTLINNYGCVKIINSGVAGALDNKLDIGDIVVSVDAVQHDFTVEAIGFAKGEIPYTGLYAFPADESMRKAAVAAVKENFPNIHVYEGRICSGDQFISEKEQKEKIVSDFGGLCCEMEGAAIAQACYLNGTPFVVLRAISDKSDGSHSVEYESFKKEAAETCAKSVLAMLKNIRLKKEGNQ